MSACGAECADCQSNGAAGINDLGLVCPADFESNDAYDDFIRQYEVSGGDCN